MHSEVWKDIEGFPGYEVSSHGRVRSWLQGDAKVLRTDWSGREGHEYQSVRLYLGNGKRKKFLLHKLMYVVFHGPIPEGHQIDHIDRDKENNVLTNLRCVTIQENLDNRVFEVGPIETVEPDPFWDA